MFCLKCGNVIDDNAMKCPYCNCPTENAGTVDMDTIDTSAKSAEGLGIASIVFGALAMVFAWLFALVGWIFSGTSLALSLVGRNKNHYSKKCKIGMILSIIALVFSFLNSLLGVILML